MSNLIDQEGIWDLFFDLNYKKGDGLHGSGMTISRSDFMDMDVDEALHYQTKLVEQRRAEAKSLRGK